MARKKVIRFIQAAFMVAAVVAAIPACTDDHFVRVFRPLTQGLQGDQVIPDRNMPVMFTALNSIRIKPFNPDRMDTEGNDPEQFKTIFGNRACFPSEILCFAHRGKRGIRRGDILQCFQPLEPGQHFIPRCGENGGLPDDQCFSLPSISSAIIAAYFSGSSAWKPPWPYPFAT